ncbi:MAG: tetratricopeptide repeat protein [Bacteroidales bacterium]
MKNKSIKLLSALFLVSVLFSGCNSLSKMVKKYGEVKYEVTPNPLEVHGDKVAITIKGTIPAGYFNKKAGAFIQPILKYEGGSTTLKSFYLKGEKVQGDGTTINSKTGGSFSYTDVIDYKPEMNKSQLMVNPIAHLATKEAVKESTSRENVKTLKKAVELGDTKLADGVIYTSQRIKTMGTTISTPDGYEKETVANRKAVIYFLVNTFNLNFKIDLNKAIEAQAGIKGLNEYITKNWAIKNIDITAWASPEGEEKRNAGLSENRAKTANKYTEEQLDKFIKDLAKKTKTKFKDLKKVVNYNLKANGEDWDGFLASLEKSDIKDKNTMINVIKAQVDRDKREQEMRNMTVVFQQVEDKILPPLRRAEISVNFLEPKKTDEQIALFSTTAPDSLDNKELLYAATLTKDLATQLKIYKAATTIYPKDWKAYNNAAYVLIAQGNANEASSFLEKANTLSPNNSAVINNLGVVSLMKKDYKAAKSYFETAQKSGVNQNYNLGVIMIKDGNYAGAVSSFGKTGCDYNVALATLLNGNAAAAATAIECAPKDAQTYYLAAIIAARSNNANMVYDNLKKAIAQDASFKAQAKDDLEFAKFAKTAEFENAIK